MSKKKATDESGVGTPSVGRRMTKKEVTAFSERLRPMVLISQTLDALREHCNEPMYRPHYLVLEAVRVAKERDNAEGLAAIECVFRTDPITRFG